MKFLVLGYLASFLFGFVTAAAAQETPTFVADTWSYRLYTIENPCTDLTQSRRNLKFRAEFRDPVLARNPEIVADAARVGAHTLLNDWRNTYTCINHGNFVGEVSSYYNGNLMFRAKTHLKDRLRTSTTTFAERYGGLVRGTPFSMVIRAFGEGEYRNGQAPFGFEKLLNDLANVAATDDEKPHLEFVFGDVADSAIRSSSPVSTKLLAGYLEQLNSASENGQEGATLALLNRTGIRELIYEIRSRAKKGDARISDAEAATLAQHQGIIERALEQKVGVMMMLKSDMDRVGLSIDPSEASTNTNSLPVAYNIERALNRMLRQLLTGTGYSCDMDWCYAGGELTQLRFVSRGDPDCTEIGAGQAKCDFTYFLNVRAGDFLQLEGDLRTLLMNTMTDVAAEEKVRASAIFRKSGNDWFVLPPITPK